MLASLLHGRTALDLTLLAFAALVMPALSALAGGKLKRSQSEQGGLIRRNWQTMARGWIVTALLLLAWSWSKRPTSELGLDWPIGLRGRIGFGLDALAIVVLAIQLIRLPTLAADRLDKAKATLKRIKIAPRSLGELVVFVPVAITAGVWEELLYRGFLIWFLAPTAGLIGAVLVSSAIFGLGHAYQGWRGVLTTALVGLIFAVLYVASGSLWWLMLAHAMVDIYGGIAAFRIAALFRRAEPAAA